MEKIYYLLFAMSNKLRYSKCRFINNIYELFDESGIRAFVSSTFNKIFIIKNENTSSKESIKSKSFFSKNWNRVRLVDSLLSDKKSKIVYRSMIRFRCTGKYRDLPPYTMKNQYFDYDFFFYSNGEKMIDCGAFTGDSIKEFKKIMKKQSISDYSIIAFEPDKNNYSCIERNHADVTLIRKGAWSKTDTVYFIGDMVSQSKIVDTESESFSPRELQFIPVTSIDECLECKKATMIKMDIEGAEMEALKGAENTIKTNKPKLAICIYHSDEDMVRLAEWIHSLVPEYKFYIRQHSNSRYETVLYATL